MMYAHQCLIDKTNTNNPNFYYSPPMTVSDYVHKNAGEK